MKLIRENLKVIIAFIIGIILASSITVYAYNFYATDVKYTDDKSVAEALNELYLSTSKELSVEVINHSYTNGYITSTTTKDYNYIIITGCKWKWMNGHISSSFTITGEYENYINKFGVAGNDLSNSDASDIAIIKNVKEGAVITVGEGNSEVYKNLNIVGVCIH